MQHLLSESNILPLVVVIDETIVDVNINVQETIKEDETIYLYDTFRFQKNELSETEYYKIKVEALIRTKYSVNDEMAIIRQKDTKPEEFSLYNEYAEHCKELAKEVQQ